jgi:putative membrane protein
MTLKDRFTEDDRNRVNQAVVSAERKTAAEIVPVIAESSGRYERAEDLCGLWTGLLLMIVAWSLLPAAVQEPGSWSSTGTAWHPLLLAVSVVVGFLLGAAVSGRVPMLRSLFVPRQQMRQQVEARAGQAFFDNRVHHTEGAGGVLLYVSLFEHQAVVLADRRVLELVGQDQIDRWCRDFTQSLHGGTVIAALCETVTVIGEALADKLPATAETVNELPNALVIID